MHGSTWSAEGFLWEESHLSSRWCPCCRLNTPSHRPKAIFSRPSTRRSLRKDCLLYSFTCPLLIHFSAACKCYSSKLAWQGHEFPICIHFTVGNWDTSNVQGMQEIPSQRSYMSFSLSNLLEAAALSYNCKSRSLNARCTRHKALLWQGNQGIDCIESLCTRYLLQWHLRVQ